MAKTQSEGHLFKDPNLHHTMQMAVLGNSTIRKSEATDLSTDTAQNPFKKSKIAATLDFQNKTSNSYFASG